MPPKVIGPYRVLETLGSGGVGTVYRAIDRRTGEPAALKLLSTGPALDPRAARRLAREFETLYDLSHPNVVKVFDTGVFQGYPYLAMELVEGLNLRQYLSLSSEDLASSPGTPRRPSFEGEDDEYSESFDPDSDAGVDADSDEVTAIDAVRFRDDDASSDAASGYAPKPFDLSRFSDESPSEDVAAFESGPDSVRALADLADEPDTNTGTLEIPWELPATAVTARTDRPPDVNFDQLNRPERVGRLTDAMMQLSQALAYIHAHGLVHRDLKPSNVMVDEDRIVRLMDFGLAKFLADDTAVTADGRLVGTFRYMAPEQILGEPLDARADLYSLGVILYELLTGRPPFDAKTPYELWQKVLETDAHSIFSVNPKVNVHLARIAHRLIRKEPDDRFQTAEEVYEALSEL